MRRLLLLLLVPAAAADPGFKEAFDAGFRGDRGALFRSALARHGAAKAVPHLRRFEDALEDLQKALDRAWDDYRKVADKWWDWRRKYEKDHQRKHKRPPAEYPMPPGLNQQMLDREKAFKAARADKMKEQIFQDAVLQRLEGKSDPKFVAACGRGLHDRNRRQRVRCARLLVRAKAEKEIAAAIRRAKHPVVLQTLLEACRDLATVQPFLAHAEPAARAGAAFAIGAIGTPEATRLLEARLPQETGRGRDDIAAALGKDPGERIAFLGGASSSRAIVFCIDGTRPQVYEALEAELKKTLDALPDDARFGIVVYDRDAMAWKKSLQPASAKASVQAFLDKHEPSGGSNVHAGLMAALDLEPDTIFLACITGPQASQLDRSSTVFEDPRQVALEFTRANDLHGVRVHAYGRSGGAESFYLQAITKQFRGAFLGPE